MAHINFKCKLLRTDILALRVHTQMLCLTQQMLQGQGIDTECSSYTANDSSSYMLVVNCHIHPLRCSFLPEPHLISNSFLIVLFYLFLYFLLPYVCIWSSCCLIFSIIIVPANCFLEARSIDSKWLRSDFPLVLAEKLQSGLFLRCTEPSVYTVVLFIDICIYSWDFQFCLTITLQPTLYAQCDDYLVSNSISGTLNPFLPLVFYGKLPQAKVY